MISARTIKMAEARLAAKYVSGESVHKFDITVHQTFMQLSTNLIIQLVSIFAFKKTQKPRANFSMCYGINDVDSLIWLANMSNDLFDVPVHPEVNSFNARCVQRSVFKLPTAPAPSRWCGRS